MLEYRCKMVLFTDSLSVTQKKNKYHTNYTHYYVFTGSLKIGHNKISITIYTDLVENGPVSC